MEYEVRSLATIPEFREHERLQREVWGSGSPDARANLLAAGARHGAVVLGAYAGDELVGILYGFPALSSGRLHHHSHLLGVLPEHRRHGVGLALKLRQRDLVRAQGVDLVTWTVDPLELGNNLFNFGTLGVTSRTYLVDAYGEMEDALNRGLPSDRLEVRWDLARDLRILPDTEPADAIVVSTMAVSMEDREFHERVAPHWTSGEDQRPVLVEAPLDYRAIKAADPDLALAWRLHVRRIMMRLFESGYVLTGCVRRSGTGAYVFSAGVGEHA